MSEGRVTFILCAMLFAHTYADFCLQGIMASMKQKTWWEKQEDYDKNINGKDYVMALLNHSIQWTFCVMLPIFVQDNWEVSWVMALFFVANVFLHFWIDNLKANKHYINLIHDQAMHFFQIVWIFVMWLALR